MASVLERCHGVAVVAAFLPPCRHRQADADAFHLPRRHRPADELAGRAPTQVFSAHFVLTRAHPGRISQLVTHPKITLGQARLTLEFFGDRLPEKKLQLVGTSPLGHVRVSTHPKITLGQARLTLEFFGDRLPEKKLQLVGTSPLGHVRVSSASAWPPPVHTSHAHHACATATHAPVKPRESALIPFCNVPPLPGRARLHLAAFIGHRLPSQTNTSLFCTLCPHSCAPGKNFPIGHPSLNYFGDRLSEKKLQLVDMSILLILLSPRLGCHSRPPLLLVGEHGEEADAAALLPSPPPPPPCSLEPTPTHSSNLTPTLVSPCLHAVVTAFLPPCRRIWTWEELTGLPAPPPILPPPAARVALAPPLLLLSAASSSSAAPTLFPTASVTPPPHRPSSPRQL
uniref:Uncharacterized protein n=1 Tax=Oryza sativa subsp. japonica TaxID=39947 RepID=Q6YXT4_ORYSJ|nr:hypothetical protein [Oryza sativa Japonica Group]